jgi:hypothetical protein
MFHRQSLWKTENLKGLEMLKEKKRVYRGIRNVVERDLSSELFER